MERHKRPLQIVHLNQERPIRLENMFGASGPPIHRCSPNVGNRPRFAPLKNALRIVNEILAPMARSRATARDERGPDVIAFSADLAQR
jgi:hypothetical protein